MWMAAGAVSLVAVMGVWGFISLHIGSSGPGSLAGTATARMDHG
jgi:hypothetical protein